MPTRSGVSLKVSFSTWRAQHWPSIRSMSWTPLRSSFLFPAEGHKLVTCAVDSLQVNGMSWIFLDLPTQEHDQIVNRPASCPFASGPSCSDKLFAGKYEVRVFYKKFQNLELFGSRRYSPARTVDLHPIEIDLYRPKEGYSFGFHKAPSRQLTCILFATSLS
jgi:hypothetical protein